MSNIATRISGILERIHAAAERAGRNTASVKLVAVSKTHPADAVAMATATGQQLFGESRVQEARGKIPCCPQGLEWHFIGHLQKNKVRQALPLFDVFHSLDSVTLARNLSRVAEETGQQIRGLIEVNISGEATKHGFTPEALRAEFPSLIALPALHIIGLMTMAPYSENPEEARPVFWQLRELREEMQKAHDHPLPDLSMGMSGDFEVAIEEGSTLVRVGTAIFGERPAII